MAAAVLPWSHSPSWSIRSVLTAILVVASLLGIPAAAAHPDGTGTLPVAASGTVDGHLDLRAARLPAHEPEHARAALTCELDDEQLCSLLVELALDLDFAWHRSGYSVRLRDGRDAPVAGTGRITGRARRREREIEVFVHWADTVVDPVGAFRGIERTLAHELGHVMHQTCGDHMLERWREVRGIPDDVPLRGHGHEGHLFHSVAEDLADTAMVWLTAGRYRSRSPLGPEPLYPGAGPSPTDAIPDGLLVVCTPES